MVVLISDKVDFRTKEITREGECYIMIKVSVHQEDLKLLNVYSSENRAGNGAKINRTKRKNR